MYLFSIEGGDGSGKGLATQIVREILQSEFCFKSVEITAEPRRDHALGRLAIESVRRQTLSPEQSFMINYDAGNFLTMFMANMDSEVDADGSLTDVVPFVR